MNGIHNIICRKFAIDFNSPYIHTKKRASSNCMQEFVRIFIKTDAMIRVLLSVECLDIYINVYLF